MELQVHREVREQKEMLASLETRVLPANQGIRAVTEIPDLLGILEMPYVGQFRATCSNFLIAFRDILVSKEPRDRRDHKATR